MENTTSAEMVKPKTRKYLEMLYNFMLEGKDNDGKDVLKGILLFNNCFNDNLPIPDDEYSSEAVEWFVYNVKLMESGCSSAKRKVRSFNSFVDNFYSALRTPYLKAFEKYSPGHTFTDDDAQKVYLVVKNEYKKTPLVNV